MKNLVKLITIFAITGVVFCLLAETAFAEFVFLKYYDYLVPVSVCEELGVTDAGNPIERVIYIDDVGYNKGVPPNSGEDPNGVQDLVVVMALDKMNTGAYEIDLRGVGTTSDDWRSHKVIWDIVKRERPSLKVRATEPHGYVEQLLKDFIIEEALAMKKVCGNHKLIIAAGGPLVVLKNALEEQPEIKDYIKVITIGGWNHYNYPSWKNAYKYVKEQLGDQWVKTIPDRPGRFPQENGTNSETFNFRVPYRHGVYNDNFLDNYYSQHIPGKLHPDYHNYANVARDLNANEGSGNHRLRTADFLTIYELILHHNNPWERDSTYHQASILNFIDDPIDAL